MIAQDKLEIRLSASPEIEQKIETLKGFLAYSNPGISLSELFDKLCDLGLQEWKPSAAPRKRRVSETSAAAQRRQIFARALRCVATRVFERPPAQEGREGAAMDGP